MCEPASLALAVLTTFKEVYLVCRFVYRVNVSRQNADPERRKLEQKFRYEILFLQSLGQYFVQAGSIVDNEQDNQRWLRQIHEIVERIRLQLADYSRIAADEDSDYQAHSPFMNESMYDTALIEFDLGEELPPVPKPVSISTKALRWFGIKASQKVNDNLDAWKWALVEKRKFESVLVAIRDENRLLKDILPLMSACTSRHSPMPIRMQSNTTTSHEDHGLGLATHARLREISSSPGVVGGFTVLSGKLHFLTPTASSPLIMGKVVNKSAHDPVLVEHKYYDQNEDLTEEESELAHRRARQLASLLTSAGNGGLATLAFRGLREEPTQSRHTFAFDFPTNTDTTTVPMSLYDMISSNKVDVRLNLPSRFIVAAKLAKAIATLHSDGWVHKSLRSDSVVFFRENLSRSLMVKNPYLVNFEYSRPQASHTKLEVDTDPERNLYRHPDRQGEPRTSFTRLHDIYSLGVVLLEIGLWQTVSSIVKEVKVPSGRQSSVNSILKQITKRRLAHHMGPTYAEAVLSCLDDRLEHRTADVDFPMIFHDEVIQKIDVRALWERT
ncbi:hypothetical protein CC86DRAFT_111171 [Ophiobolus disseminans]|uniref:Protein kinase domain-containing protein n=1 Tax=Ophiobolus disseminans TaxID=1469910 RepID=A0A6A6ZJS4_9PLEO|nr:hypothetical protein CC86DRAFT_111171 [Ophiobolus disseminans]